MHARDREAIGEARARGRGRMPRIDVETLLRANPWRGWKVTEGSVQKLLWKRAAAPLELAGPGF